MQGVSLYPEQNDIKVYLEKVSKVFQKMEKDLGTYRLKDNEPEKLLKMLKKRAQVSELVFGNLFQNMLDDQPMEYTNLFQQIDKFLKQHQNSVIQFINSYFSEKNKREKEEMMGLKNQHSHANYDKSSEESLDSNLNNKSSEEAFQQNWPSSPKKSMIMNKETEHAKDESHTEIEQQFHKSSYLEQPNMSKSKSNLFDNGQVRTTQIMLSKTRVNSPQKGRLTQMVEKVQLRLLPFGRTSKIVKPKQLENRQSSKVDLSQFRPQNELFEKIKKLETKVKVQDEQLKEMEGQYEKLYKEKAQIARNFENLRKMNEHLMNHAEKQQRAETNKENNQMMNNNNKFIQAMKKQSIIDKRNNSEFRNLMNSLQQIQLKQDGIGDDSSQVRKILNNNERVAVQKVNYWGDIRKGLKEKISRVSGIQQSNVQKQLQSLLTDLEIQKSRLTGKENRKKIDEEDDDFESDDSDKNDNKQYKKGYCIMKDVGTDPDNELFDLEKIEKDLVIFQKLSDDYEQEMIEKNHLIKKLTSQMESYLKMMEDDEQRQKQNEQRILDMQMGLDKMRKQNGELKDQLAYIKNHYGVDASNMNKKQVYPTNRAKNNIYENSHLPSGAVPAILQKKYEDPFKITDIRKLQEMCADLQNENYELRLRVHELETLLKKHNIVIPPGNTSLYSKDALQQMLKEGTHPNQVKQQYKQQQLQQKQQQQAKRQGDHAPFDSFNKQEMMLQGKQLFANQKKAEQMMKEKRSNFHNMTAAEQQKFLQNLTPEQQQQFLNSLSADQKKQFIAAQMKTGNKEFMEQMMENFDNLDPEMQKQFLQNMSKEDQKKFFEKKKKFEKEKKEMEKLFENFDNLTKEEQEKILSKMTAEEKEKFFKKKAQYEEKKAQEKYMDNMMQNYDKLTEKEKQEFLANMSEEQRTQFFKKKKEKEEREKEVARKMANFDNMTAEEQQKFMASLSPEQQQKLMKENKQKFMENMAKNFDNMTAEEQQKFLANLSPDQQKEFFQAKQRVQRQREQQQRQIQKENEEKKQKLYQASIEKMLMEQVKANAKRFFDKKLQTGDDNVESFENHFINQFYQDQQMKQLKDVMKKQDEIMKKVEQKMAKRENMRNADGKIVGKDGKVIDTEDELDDILYGSRTQSGKPRKKGQKGKGGLLTKNNKEYQEDEIEAEQQRQIEQQKQKKKRIKVVGPDGQVQFVTDDSGEDISKRKKKKKRINSRGEVEYVTDEDWDPSKPQKKQKRVIGKNGEVFYVTDSEAEENMTLQQRQQKQAEKLKQQEEKRQRQLQEKKEKEAKERELKQISEHLLKQMDQKVRDRQNKGGYLDGEQFLNNAEMDYLYDMMKNEYALKGEGMFDNKGDNIMQMFKHMFKMGKNGVMPTPEEFKEFMLRIQKMHLKCGLECKHLKRFFNRLGLIRKGWWTNRIPLKMSQPSVDPMNTKLPKIENYSNTYGGSRGFNR